jgi:hypothetical protein
VRFVPLAVALALGLSAVHAEAHGGLSMERDTCKLRIGSYVMHFTGYQPDSSAAREFCEDIPEIGRTVIVLDYLDDALRDLPVEVRIIRNTGDESDLEKVTVFEKPPAVYPRGSVAVEYTFPEPGRFVGLVTVGGSGPQLVSRFPFAVGTSGFWMKIFYVGAAAAALAAGAALFLYSSRKAGASA